MMPGRSGAFPWRELVRAGIDARLRSRTFNLEARWPRLLAPACGERESEVRRDLGQRRSAAAAFLIRATVL